MVVLLGTTQSHKEWWSGAQLHPLVLCLSVTSHSCSEESGPHHLHFQVFSPLQITCTVVSESLATALWNGEGDGTHSSALAWRVPGTAEPGGLQSMGSLGVGHDWATSLSLFAFMHWRRKWEPTPVFLPGESRGRQSRVGCCLWGRTESDTTEVT